MAIRSSKNWFDQGGEAYRRFRPAYPAELPDFLASIAPNRQFAADVGCGNGQLTCLLAGHFNSVVGIDPSAEQIANAIGDARVRYFCAPAEQLPLADNEASLVVAAQAAHWFELPVFFREVRRVCMKGGVVALASYGKLRVEPALADRFDRFYSHDIGPYWPPERKLVDTGYATVDFPFEEITAPPMAINLNWNFDELLGYLSTWSAVRRAKEAGQEAVLASYASDLRAAWGDPAVRRNFTWPITIRTGFV